MKNLLKLQKGSVALISILIISAITLLLVLGMSEISISTSYQYLNNSINKDNYYSAEACLEEALIRVEQNPSFIAGAINFDSGASCTISVNGDAITITVNYLDYSETFQADTSLSQIGEANNIELLNWNEI